MKKDQLKGLNIGDIVFTTSGRDYTVEKLWHGKSSSWITCQSGIWEADFEAYELTGFKSIGLGEQ